jgi:hypothetical protein
MHITGETIMDDEVFGLTRGIRNLHNALESTHPGIGKAELEVLGDALLNQLSRAIEAGEKLGSLVPKPDGKVELRIWDILGKK